MCTVYVPRKIWSINDLSKSSLWPLTCGGVEKVDDKDDNALAATNCGWLP